MKAIKTAILLLFLAMTVMCTANSPFVITANGKAIATVFVAKDASASEKLAAAELKTYIKKLSGATITDASSPAEKSIILATAQSAHLPETLKSRLTKTKHEESFIIAVENNKLYLAGKTSVGTLYAAYTLLEEEFNVSWLFPGEQFEYVEKRPSLSIKPIVKVNEPTFIYRLINPSPFNKTRDFFIWAARNRIQAPGPYGLDFTYTPKHKDFFEPRLRDGVVSTGGHLTFYLAAPPQKYRKTNPEYFALVDGKRTEKTSYSDTHHCISNPELQKLVADYIVGVYKKYGKKVNYTFGAPDTAHNWCECNNCRALDNGTADHCRRFHLVAQKIAKMVYERCPDMQLRIWAYWTYRNIPEGLTVDPRMQVYFCSHGRSYAHYLDDPNCAANVKIFNLMKEWLKLNPNLYTYEYTASNHSGYAPIYKELAHDLQLYKKLGLLGLKNEYQLPDGKFSTDRKPWDSSLLSRSHWAYYYLYGKLAWNPDLDYNKVLDDAYLKYYGRNAFPIMKNYHAERRKVWENTEGNYGWPEGDARTPKLLQNPGIYKKLSQMLNLAEKAAKKNAAVLERIRFDRRCLEELWLAKNKEYKKISFQTFFAPKLNGNVKIDGKLSEAIWSRACYVSNFKNWQTKKSFPAELETTAAVFCDDKALYIGITAKEPAMDKLTANGKKDDKSLFNDDGIEILLAPPNEANQRYQFRINSKGVALDCKQPGTDISWNSGIQSACRRDEDRYVIEVRIPFEKMEGRFQISDRCPILIGRGRRIDDGLGRGAYSLGGAAFQNTTTYRMMILGKANIQNGTFLETDPKTPGIPKAWRVKNCEIIKNGNQVSVKIKRNGVLSQHLYDPRGPLGQAPHPHNITVLFTASGKGRAVFFASHYSDAYTNGKMKRTFHGSKKMYQQTVTEKTQDFQFDYTIPANQWITIGINTPDDFIKIDRVSVLLK